MEVLLSMIRKHPDIRGLRLPNGQECKVSALFALSTNTKESLGALKCCAVFNWAEPAPEAEGGEVQDDEVELLIVQAWRTSTEGELLGILFGKVEEGHLDAITDELLVFLAELEDNLPLDILSRSDEKSGTDVLPRTLALHLLWSMCTEMDGDNCFYPSPSLYLEIDVTNLTWRGNAIEAGYEDEEEEEGEESEEEEAGTDQDDPDYSGSEEEEGSGSEEPSSHPPRSKEEEEVEAQRRREKAEGKRLIEESERLPPQLLLGDSSLNPEPPREESDGAAMEGSESRRRRRSESPTSSSQTTLRLRRTTGDRASSPVVIRPSP
ncbi:hypothetical protein CBR_g34407 [Chara braunii]|uniref:Uncharacterized protein n=1 Tax=Chara braunii TaxID=69332 RepID=A0A388LII3_CHABU|nr:hypothetical protein CBR_g34407 [Chara braunii]|eukprot:GBG82126.1 hypothetical protein CBR_g34407 [Chara braunii]